VFHVVFAVKLAFSFSLETRNMFICWQVELTDKLEKRLSFTSIKDYEVAFVRGTIVGEEGKGKCPQLVPDANDSLQHHTMYLGDQKFVDIAMALKRAKIKVTIFFHRSSTIVDKPWSLQPSGEQIHL